MIIKAPTPPMMATSGPLASNADEYEVAVVTNLNVQTSDVHNICLLVSVVLDLASTHYALWRNNMLLTLQRYALFDHVPSDATFVDVSIWDRMDNVVKSWIYDTISPEL
jgi:hypothetical protein